jgi:hypothetical protein
MESRNAEGADETPLILNPFAYGTPELQALTLKGLVRTGVVQLRVKAFISVVVVERTTGEGSMLFRVEL